MHPSDTFLLYFWAAICQGAGKAIPHLERIACHEPISSVGQKEIAANCNAKFYSDADADADATDDANAYADAILPKGNFEFNFFVARYLAKSLLLL